MRRVLLLLAVLLLGVAAGVGSRPPVEAPRITAPVGADASAVTPTEATARQVLAADAPRPAPVPAAAPPVTPVAGRVLPEGAPIAGLLTELRERARRGDAAAARRAHRDLNYCATARYAEFGTNPWDARVRCIAGQLCKGLYEADMDEAGDFLLRAAELGDVEAMAAVAEGFALGGDASSVRHLQDSIAIGPQYLRRALEAGVPLALASTYGACAPQVPFGGLQPFVRSFSVEEQYAWAVAVQTIPGRSTAQTLAATRARCAEYLDPSTLQRAEARGRALHARHLAPLADRDRLARTSIHELGIPSVDAADPRLRTWPQCATDS